MYCYNKFMVIKNKSAIKRIKVAQRNQIQNKIYKSTIKTLTKKVLLSIKDENTNDTIRLKLAELYSKIDKAVKRKILSKNTASRKKSWIAKKCA
uniref:30S ribosomal protein S20 n=1 Tax=Compsopogon caeruleus TaxID=31354 RepID=A0A1Z1XB85_9RHOD|nr:30S ribosomal protein S20 [Compsopogon caeruleus]ARX96120.1 30S ribosomal protein S20 [Compsopogon caeruleus]